MELSKTIQLEEEHLIACQFFFSLFFLLLSLSWVSDMAGDKQTTHNNGDDWFNLVFIKKRTNTRSQFKMNEKKVNQCVIGMPRWARVCVSGLWCVCVRVTWLGMMWHDQVESDDTRNLELNFSLVIRNSIFRSVYSIFVGNFFSLLFFYVLSFFVFIFQRWERYGALAIVRHLSDGRGRSK